MIYSLIILCFVITCTPKEKDRSVPELIYESKEYQEPVLTIKDEGVAIWNIYVDKLSDNKYEVRFKAIIKDKWHIYAINLPSEEGPLPTAFEFNLTPQIELIGQVKEGSAIKTFDHNFGVDVMYFEKETVFIQLVNLMQSEAKLKGNISYMACDDERCIPPVDVPFEITLK